ncbi:hypothetical protein Gpo141_00005420 [Globisporangium polare]
MLPSTWMSFSSQAKKSKTSELLCHAWVDAHRHVVLPARDLKKDSVFDDIQCSPQDYLPCMLRMMRAVGTHGTSVKNVCPLRSDVVPKHVLIDTTSLVNLCFTEEHGKRGGYTEKGNLVKRQDITWDFFKTDMSGQHRKSKEPVKRKGFRTMFRKAGYSVYLVDELRTSCSACECKTFRVCTNPRPYRSGSTLRHGYDLFQAVEPRYNRESSDVWKVAVSTIRGEGRPANRRRTRGSISV